MVKYNSPVILTFMLAATAIMLLSYTVTPKLNYALFSMGSSLNLTNPLSFFRLFSYILGHADWNHLISNATFILLLGPILEEKYGSLNLLIMILATAAISGLLNNLLFSTGVLGSSGIVFMFIILASVGSFKQGGVPLTFVLIAFLFLGREVLNALRPDSISQFGHLMGGACGAFFGFFFKKD